MAIQTDTAGIKKVSELSIDADKDWAAKKIENLGAPDSGDDAKRHDSAPAAHKDSHDPIDGTDKLDTATPVKVGSANAVGASHSLARADHVHEREHAKYTDVEAQTTVKANVEVGDLKAPTKALAMSNQKVTGLAAPAAPNDAVRADANLRAPDSTKLEGSTKTQVRDHTPKAHTLASHSTKAHSELTGVTSSQHHTKYVHPTTGSCPQTPKAHTLASHSTKAHTELTGVTADQHHPRSHDHSLAADGTPIAVSGVPNLPASKITSERFPVDRLPALTDEKIWKGTGANVEEVDYPAFTELVGAESKECAMSATWEDWDISAIVPAGTRYAVIGMSCTEVAPELGQARKNGSALERYMVIPDGTSDTGNCLSVLTEVDANRVVEIKTGCIANVHFSVLGYWK